MGWVLFTIIGSIILGISVLTLLFAKSNEAKGGGLLGAIVCSLLGVVVTLIVVIHPINAGHVGIVYTFGNITGQLSEGLQFTAPWQDVRVESLQIQRKQWDKVEAFSKETQDVFFTVTLNYSISADAVQNLYRTVGPSWFDVLVSPRIHNFFKEETVKYNTTDVAPQREEIRNNVKKALAEELNKYSINVNDFLIDNIDFHPEFKQSIINKQIATQDALREKERVAQRTNEAQQAIEVAKGEAQANIERAKGVAEANDRITKSLTKEVIQWEVVKKIGDKVQIMMLPSGQGLIIDPSTLLKGN